jgi:hypothetical protein
MKPPTNGSLRPEGSLVQPELAEQDATDSKSTPLHHAEDGVVGDGEHEEDDTTALNSASSLPETAPQVPCPKKVTDPDTPSTATKIPRLLGAESQPLEELH